MRWWSEPGKGTRDDGTRKRRLKWLLASVSNNGTAGRCESEGGRVWRGKVGRWAGGQVSRRGQHSERAKYKRPTVNKLHLARKQQTAAQLISVGHGYVATAPAHPTAAAIQLQSDTLSATPFNNRRQIQKHSLFFCLPPRPTTSHSHNGSTSSQAKLHRLGRRGFVTRHLHRRRIRPLHGTPPTPPPPRAQRHPPSTPLIRPLRVPLLVAGCPSTTAARAWRRACVGVTMC